MQGIYLPKLFGAGADDFKDRALYFVHDPHAPPGGIRVEACAQSMMAGEMEPADAGRDGFDLINAVEHIVESSAANDVLIKCGVGNEGGGCGRRGDMVDGVPLQACASS